MPHMWNNKAKKRTARPRHTVCKLNLFLHAVLGCDTTSSQPGIGKGASLKKFEESDMFQEQAEVFYEH